MFNRVFAVGLAATLWLATLPVEVSAKGSGSALSRHALGHRHHGHHRLHGGFGGYVFGIVPFSEASLPVQIGPVIPTCTLSREIVIVPSEEGGTRQITITKCPYAPDKMER
jgi:hypothetical protein